MQKCVSANSLVIFIRTFLQPPLFSNFVNFSTQIHIPINLYHIGLPENRFLTEVRETRVDYFHGIFTIDTHYQIAMIIIMFTNNSQ